MKFYLIVIFWLVATTSVLAQRKGNQEPAIQDESVFRGLRARNITPAVTGGRISDIAIHPENTTTWYAAVASGNVWKTTNAGMSWDPVFENYGSYSIGCITIDPVNPTTVWIGSGENNAQRSVSKGDGVYKSVDGGKSWKNMGLKTSEHIGRIVVDSRNPDIVYVASQGSVWKDGGERGLYKTEDGGETWERILYVSEQTGISDLIMDFRNPDILLASSYQRRRHPGVLVAGGPDGGIWKTTDGGENWKKLTAGLPGGDLGRIGLAQSPQQPDVLYALIIGKENTRGFYRSENMGESWQKMSDYTVVDAQYYVELFPDPVVFDKVYSVNTRLEVTEDGGRTFDRVQTRGVHVDHHAMAFDPNNPHHILLGNDGGVYESWDNTETWRHFKNLPITQFYRVGIDNSYPFYFIYGGTQDNATLGGPAGTLNGSISNSDWFVTTGGDGFQSRVDPENPNIIYSESQYGRLVRYDKQTGQTVGIQPQEEEGEEPYRWHWNAPLLVSHHENERLYFAANVLFQSDDRGNTWKKISDDLSMARDRNKMEVMGRVWSIDAVFKNVWTSPMGTIVSLDESPLQEGLLIAGTDDGQVQLTTNGGESWTKLTGFDGLPANTYVADVHASRTDANTFFVVFNNHKFGDYTPYVYKTTNMGQSWTSISEDLDNSQTAWTIYQDHENKNVLFLGTEMGLHFSVDGGQQWIPVSGIPTIAIRDLEIQKREDDLVAASFGRGFFILDDYSALREVNQDILNREAYIFTVREALQYRQIRGNIDDYSSPGEPFGVVFTYYLREGAQTLEQQRHSEEQQKVSRGEPVYYPTWDAMIDERIEERPALILSILDSRGNEIQRLKTGIRRGIQRVIWDFEDFTGTMVPPGRYTVSLSKIVNGEWEKLGVSQEFSIKPLDLESIEKADPKEKYVFVREAHRLNTAVNLSARILSDMLNAVDQGLDDVAGSPLYEESLYEKLADLKRVLYDMDIELNGNEIITEKMELDVPSIRGRIRNGLYGAASTTYPVTSTQKEAIRMATEAYRALTEKYNRLLNEELLPVRDIFQRNGSGIYFPADPFIIY